MRAPLRAAGAKRPRAPPWASGRPPTAAPAGPARAGASWRRLPGSSRDGDGTRRGHAGRGATAAGLLSGAWAPLGVELPRLADSFEGGRRLAGRPDDGIAEAGRLQLVEDIGQPGRI